MQKKKKFKMCLTNINLKTILPLNIHGLTKKQKKIYKKWVIIFNMLQSMVLNDTTHVGKTGAIVEIEYKIRVIDSVFNKYCAVYICFADNKNDENDIAIHQPFQDESDQAL